MAQDNIEEIKSKIDIVDLLQEYIQLRPAGTNNFKAACPFHHEKTPSFMVSRDKQIWHCFGCGEGGDIFSFIMKIEGAEFPEALRLLAKKAGVELQYRDPALHNQKTRILDICRTASRFYHQILLDHPKAQSTRDYLKKRQVTDETVESWQLGFAPDSYEVLSQYLIKKGFSEEDIFLAGLTIKKERAAGYYDRFRNRLMFPISDVHGSIIGFGGRWLGPDSDQAAKYINSPQTLVYNKSAVLYGIDRAKQEIKQQKSAIIVEGYMDCLASHQAGVTNVVASSGTALTPEQVRLLKRFTTNLIFSFDQDLAGDSAARRGIEVAWQAEMNTKVIQLTGAKDPDELIRKDRNAWLRAIAEARSVMDYYFESTLKKANLKSVDDKKQVARTLLSVIASLVDPVEQTHYIQQLGHLLSVPEEALRDKLKQLTHSVARSHPSKESEKAPVSPAAKDRFSALAELVIGILLAFPSESRTIFDQLLPEYVPGEQLCNLYKYLVIYYTEKHTLDPEAALQQLRKTKREVAMYADILVLQAQRDFAEADESVIRHEIEEGLRELKRNYIKQALHETERQLRQAEQRGDMTAIEKYNQACVSLMAEMKQIE